MSSTDLFLLIATVALIFIASFFCATLYWCIRTLKVWYRLSSEAERNVHAVGERVHEFVHVFTSLRAVIDIGIQALQTALAVHRTGSRSRSKKKSHDEATS